MKQNNRSAAVTISSWEWNRPLVAEWVYRCSLYFQLWKCAYSKAMANLWLTWWCLILCPASVNTGCIVRFLGCSSYKAHSKMPWPPFSVGSTLLRYAKDTSWPEWQCLKSYPDAPVHSWRLQSFLVAKRLQCAFGKDHPSRRSICLQPFYGLLPRLFLHVKQRSQELLTSSEKFDEFN